jgi:hypothetical protein
LLVAPLLLALSCGGEEGGESLGVSNVSPLGSVGGLVVDAATGQPLEGVKVSVIAGGSVYPDADKPCLTNAKGYFSVKDVPAGALIVQLAPRKAGTYGAVSITDTLPGAAGEFPLGNATLSLGPVGLVPLAGKDSAFSVLLITPDGAPATTGMVKAYAHAPVGWVDLTGGATKPMGTTVVSASTGSSGVVTFTGLPDYSKLAGIVGSGGVSDLVRVRIPPYDSDKDGALDFLGKEQSFYVNRLDGSVPTVVLSSDSKPSKLTIQASNLAGLAATGGDKLLGTSSGGTIYITFNLPILQSLTTVTIYDELGQPVVLVPKIQVSGSLLTVTLSGLQARSEYNMSLRTYAQVEGNLLEGTFGAPLFTPGKKDWPVSATLTRDTTDNNKILVTFSEPVGTGVANKHLSGSNAIVFFDRDIDGSGIKGDFPAELGASSSSVTLYIDEKDPPGPAGKSGLSTRWYFKLPNETQSGTPIPAKTFVKMLFSHSSALVQRATGKLVPDLAGLAVP